jgi:RimJ/RimL family protein N-acetyltransferase
MTTPRCIDGKRIRLRDVEVADAGFILSLRLDPELNQHISKTDGDLSKQVAWIERYKAQTTDYYFIIEEKDGTAWGTVRIYDIRGDSFCWGSWIVRKDAPTFVAMESALLIYEFGFGVLGFAASHFDVRKGNERVVQFHQRFGARITGEDAENFYFQLTREDYAPARKKYAKFLE